MVNKRRWRIFWILAGLFALGCHLLLSAYPHLAERVYGQYVFTAIRFVLSYTLGLLPVPAVWLVVIAGLWWLYKTALIPIRKRNVTWPSFVMGVLSTAGGMIFLFQMLWGFNYTRPAWDVRTGITVSQMTAEALTAEFDRATSALISAASQLEDLEPLTLRSGRDHEASVRPLLRQVLRDHGYSLSPSPRVRLLRPEGLLMRWNTAGIYIPFSGEGHVDAGMLPVQIPFTLAHEMAHGFGVADEGDCNFLAYLTCLRSSDQYVRFAGLLAYWRYVAAEYRRAHPESYPEKYQTLPELVQETLIAIHENNARFPGIMPRLRDAVYDTYLRTQGVHEGLYSYNRVVQLVAGYESIPRQDPEQ